MVEFLSQFLSKHIPFLPVFGMWSPFPHAFPFIVGFKLLRHLLHLSLLSSRIFSRSSMLNLSHGRQSLGYMGRSVTTRWRSLNPIVRYSCGTSLFTVGTFSHRRPCRFLSFSSLLSLVSIISLVVVIFILTVSWLILLLCNRYHGHLFCDVVFHSHP